MNDPIRRGTLEMTSAMLICGTIGWLVLLSGQPVLDVVFWRCVFGFAALLVACAVLGFLRRGSLGREAFLLALLSGVFIVGNWVLLFASYSRASIAIGTAVYNVQPFMLVGLGAAFLGEKVTARKLGWLGLSFAGMLAIVSAHGDSDAPRGDYLFGILLALAAALLYAFAALIVKRLQGTPPHLIALIQVGTGVLMLAPLANLAELPRGVAPWASLATLGIVHTGLMYVLLYGAIQKLPTALTGALSFIYPVAAILVDWLVFEHRLSLAQWLGVAAILLAAAGMQMAHDRGLRGALQARFGLSFSLAFGVGKEFYDSRSAGSGWSWKDLAWDLAGAADLAMAFYNPISRARPWQLGRALEIVARHRSPQTLVVLGRDIGRPGERLLRTTLGELRAEQVDMRTLVIIGSSTTRSFPRADGEAWVYTPRWYPSE
ncbi:hypothetical protein ALP65_00932 [Pseudomonas aeruginosa]|uniref:EamA domain-containing protein n=4 Tax=Pseudomonas aeruginosa TaxID=287 RepID=A0A3M5EWP3_PSEAI|nr:hypothetical protein ALP65_00932 [Pseudomonas aeruginosa]